MSKISEPLILFNPKLPRLSKSEKAVLKLLIEAGKLIVPIYKLQENTKFPGANFYPHDATKTEITKAAQNDSQILSPYAVVERVNGKLVAVPYHIKYADYLKPIADKLEEAASISENRGFANTLKVQAKALLKGSYEDTIRARSKMKVYNLDISIGPDDYFDDQLFYTKNSYQAWVGVMEVGGTERLNNYKSTILNATRRGFIPTERVNNYEKIKAKVIDTVLFAGLMAKTKFPGVNYPIDINMVEMYGSEITLFNQPNDLMMKEEIIPAFNRIFPKEFKDEYTFEDLRRGNLRYIAMHELAHSFLYYRHASDNLKDLFRPIYELAATILGFRMAGSLLLKDRINEKQLESMIVVLLCRYFYLTENKRVIGSLPEYVLGATIFLNFMMQSGSLKSLKGIAVPNFTKIFMSLQDLFDILERLLSVGNRKEAESFVKNFGGH